MSDQLGRVLGGRYRLAASIGTGASAQVFLADDVTLHRRVAVKVLHPGLAADESFLRRFRDEARAAAALSHPNLMAVYDWGEDDGPYLVLEYLGGGSLRALLDEGHRLTPSQALVIGLEAARALDVAHRRGFVHRDIKPANLLFGEDGRLRVADFGLARALSEAGWTEPGDGLVGTARYAAPEQARGGRVDGRADVYSLGLVLIEAVTGSVPLTGEGALETMMTRVDTPVPVPEAMGLLAPILERMGQPDPALRPDAAEVARVLVDLARQLERPAPLPLAGVDIGAVDAVGDVAAATDPDLTVHRRGADATGVLPRVPARRTRRWPWVLLAIVALLAVVAGAVAVFSQLATPSADVPRVLTLPRDEALARIKAADEAATDVAWHVDVTEAYDEHVPAGSVVDQRPGPGAGLDDGGTVRLVVSKIDGATQEAASQALTTAGFKVGAVSQAADENVPQGSVLRWRYHDQDNPPKVPKGEPVDLVVSSGPAPRTIPDLRNQVEADAKARLEGLGLAVARSEDFDDTIAVGRVIRTTPPAGGSAARGSTVTLVVSKGPDLVVVPDISGAATLEQAIALIESRGLVAGEVNGDAKGKPFATDPPAGEKVKRGSTVDIFLRRRR
jgi:serine/threonine-protein kinase